MKKNKNYIDIINKKDIIEAISMHKYAFYNKIKMNKYI